MTPNSAPWLSSYHTRVRDAVLVGPTMIIGPPGAGKSTTARMVALEVSGREPEVLNCHAGISPSALWHTYEFDGTRSVRLPGQLSRALVEDRVLIVEDFTQLPIELRAVFLFLGQDRVVDPVTRDSYDASRLRVIFTSNPESASPTGRRAAAAEWTGPSCESA